MKSGEMKFFKVLIAVIYFLITLVIVVSLAM